MNCFCIGSRKPLTQKFTVLLVHVVGSTQSALRHSTPFAIQLVKDFFIEHTKVDINKVKELSDRFRNLEVDSRLEIVFKGKPKGFDVSSHAVFTHQSEYGLVIFEVETRVTSRYTGFVPKVMKYIFLPLSYWSQPVLTGWERWGGPLSS